MTVRRALTLLVPAGAALALMAGQPASAHILPSPTFIAQGAQTTISLDVPNERAPHATVGLVFTAPRGFMVVSVEPTAGWKPTIDDRTVTWTGGRLSGGQSATFRVGLVTDVAPGPATLRAKQRYDDGQTVNWQIPFSVVPPVEASSGSSDDQGRLVLVAIVAALVVAATIAILLLVRRRQRS